jgi:hypothetical protein
VQNQALRNTLPPTQLPAGETGFPALPLELYYLLTAYGEAEDETDPLSHKLMGHALRIMHDHPVLGRVEIRDALAGNDLHEQVERIRISPQPLTLDELSKLWGIFQTHYRLSASFHVSVVLIDSYLPSRSPPPVLRRGSEDQGVQTLLGPFPAIERITPPQPFTSARLGDRLVIQGHHLDGAMVRVRFRHPELSAALELHPAAESTDARLVVNLPNDTLAQTVWASGLYTVTVAVSQAAGEPPRVSNAMPMALAPRVTDITPNPAARDPAGNVDLQLEVSPEVLPGQQAALLLGERSVAAGPHLSQTETLDFNVVTATAGEFLVRLRIDGVDSLPVVATPDGLAFDPNQKVTLT